MNLLITGAWQDACRHIAEIEQMEHRQCFVQQEKDALPCDYAWADGGVCRGGDAFPLQKLDTFKERQRNHQWLKQRDLPELNGKTVRIIGGDVGKECAKRFEAPLGAVLWKFTGTCKTWLHIKLRILSL